MYVDFEIVFENRKILIRTGEFYKILSISEENILATLAKAGIIRKSLDSNIYFYNI